MSDEPEARMWEDEGTRYESRSRGSYFESAFASTEHLDRAPLLSEETYSEVQTTSTEDHHCHWKPQNQPPSSVPQLLAALLLCAVFMVCELVGGYLAGSLSVMSDAAHMLSDCGGFALALFAFRCARRPPNATMSYGYRRAEVLGAMASVLLIWALTGIFVYVAALRIHTGEYNIKPDMMMIVSGCGVAFNVVLALVLHGCASDIAHYHSHGGAACGHAHTHEERPRIGFKMFRRSKHNGLVNGDYSLKDMATVEADVHSRTKNINLRAALVHVIGDLIQSCGVLLASVLIKFYPDAKIVDPICTFVFSVLVLLTSARVVRDALSMLMQAVPANFKYRECVCALRGVRGVRHVHSLHVWALSSHYTVLSAHIAIDDVSESERVLQECQALARQQFQVQAATLQVERHAPRAACAQCRQPADTP
ncbi:PREDICTED: zinc transporter 2-like [Papilio polytes]|uniref:zinc transporter 2-like n=1 Tax=Papilio polytes TaxID=76194 RepID=UPI0006762A98|nr:PREDICTED: zinc transporter 2-like [Papilio polytes]XP_013137988.1 PREDICTED: zinc transporter 2-like [Papilio polytes]